MIYRKYGKTKKKISVLGFGGSRFRKEDYANNSFEYPVKIIRKANELGINFFDTAPHYCDGKSEIILGEAFRKMPREFYVSTKSRVIEDSTADDVRRKIEISLKRLNVNKIDFFDMWAISSFNEYKDIIKKGGPYDGVLKAKEEGLIDHITFSSRLSPKKVIKIIDSGLFEGVMLSYNIINFPLSENVIKKAEKAGLGVTIMNPLSGGIIPRHQDYFSFIKENKKESIAQAALRFVMSTKGVTSALCGIPSISKLYDSIKQCNKIKIMSDQKINLTKRRIDKNLSLLCNSCHNCIVRCPKNIYIHMYMEAYNLKIIQNNIRAVKSKIAELKNRPIYKKTALSYICDGCKKCEKYCPKNLNIIERLKFISKEIESNLNEQN